MDFNTWLQSRLTAHGFPVGSIDGKIGPITTAALRAFQLANNIQATGTATESTVAALKRSASAITPAEKAIIGNIDTPAPLNKLPSIVAPTWPRQKDVPAFYGAVGTNQKLIEIPYDMKLSWSDASPKRMSVHVKIADLVERSLQRVAETYNAKERASLGLDVFGGSLNVRKMRGGNNYSMHSWGIALDFDPNRNGLMTRAPQARLSHDDCRPFWQIWKDVGALPLGEAIGRDFMHVQFARL